MATAARPQDVRSLQEIRSLLLGSENCTGQLETVFAHARCTRTTDFPNLRAFQRFVLDYPEIFILNEFRNKVYLSLTTQLTVCPQHSRKSGSCRQVYYGRRSCDDLHICLFYLLSGICDFEDECFFGHSFHTPHNQAVLAEHFLDGLGISDLRAILTLPYVRRGVTRPQVCSYYNSQPGCRKDDGTRYFCKSLHICRHYVINDCRFGIECHYNHDVINNDQVEDVLELYGVSLDRRPKLILEDLFMYMRDEEDGDQVRNHAIWLQNQCTQGPQLSRQTSVPNLRQAAVAPGIRRSASVTPAKPRQICRFYLQGRCKFGSTCKNLHSSHTSQSAAPVRTLSASTGQVTSPARMLSDSVSCLEDLLRRASIGGAQASNSYPSHWNDMPGKEHLVVVLSPSAPEFQRVLNRFLKDLPRAKVKAIRRVQNRAMWDLFFAQKQTMERKYGEGRANELNLFHGTPMQSVEPILYQNIDPLLAGNNVGAKYGRGAYFAVDSQFSDSYTSTSVSDSNYRYMFYARVLAGTVTRGVEGMKRPPPRSPSDPTSLYDAVVDCVASPRIYVVFRNQQIYPEYLIQYQR